MLKTTTRAVMVEVVVTGGTGASVGGLQQRDFTVIEDGSPSPSTSRRARRNKCSGRDPSPTADLLTSRDQEV